LAAEKQSQILSSWLSELEKIDQRDQFAALEIPVQIILGQNDILIKSNIQNQIRQLNPYTHCSIIKDCGHAPFISRPDETYNVINKFLNERI
jgi:pimeloyl-[acyl-carrier protein] methyl ester esterase